MASQLFHTFLESHGRVDENGPVRSEAVLMTGPAKLIAHRDLLGHTYSTSILWGNFPERIPYQSRMGTVEFYELRDPTVRSVHEFLERIRSSSTELTDEERSLVLLNKKDDRLRGIVAISGFYEAVELTDINSAILNCTLGLIPILETSFSLSTLYNYRGHQGWLFLRVIPRTYSVFGLKNDNSP
jgi:hypothetical protein